MSTTYHCFSTDIGLALVGVSPAGVRFLQFGDSSAHLVSQIQKHCPDEELAQASMHGAISLSRLESAIHAAVRGSYGGLNTISIAPLGSDFQRTVWGYLRSIPPGEVRSYSEVAHALDMPRSTRAVARACGANSIALLIPCHRVIRGDGSLGGFRWGVETKRRLLAAERNARVQTQSGATRAITSR